MPNLDDVIHVRDDGSEVTIYQRAIETIRAGAFTHDAAARCGVSVQLLERWLRDGARVGREILNGTKRQPDLDPAERLALQFSYEMATAEAEGKLFLLGIVRRLATGSIPMKTETIKLNGGRPAIVDDEGRVLAPEVPPTREVTTKTEHTLPDGASARWMLAARWPYEFGNHNRVELSGPGGGPIEVSEQPTVDRLLSDLERLAERRAAVEFATHELGQAPDA